MVGASLAELKGMLGFALRRCIRENRPLDLDTLIRSSHYFRRSSGKTNEVAEDEAGLTQALVAVATRKLERLREEREKTRAEDLALIAERWRAAVATSATNRAEGERLRLALLELYGERAWADDALRDKPAEQRGERQRDEERKQACQERQSIGRQVYSGIHHIDQQPVQRGI